MSRQKASAPAPAMMSVTDGADTAGFIKNCGPKGWRSFDRDGHPIGFYKTQAEAVASIPRQAGEGAR